MSSQVETLNLSIPRARTDLWQLLLATDASWTGLVLRLSLGAVMFPHGAQKVLGWFGGHGFPGTLAFLTRTMELPIALALVVIAAEFLGSLALLAGVFTRAAALGIAAVMVGAITTVHAQYGFFMNWGGNAAGEGFEYHILAIAISLALVLSGGGRWSVDRALTTNSGEQELIS